MNEIKASVASLLRRPHAQPVLALELVVYPFPASAHHEKGADAEGSPNDYRDLC